MPETAELTFDDARRYAATGILRFGVNGLLPASFASTSLALLGGLPSLDAMRKLHRWISPFAALFLLSVAVTGTILQFQKFLGGEEAEREKLAAAVSTYTLTTPLADLPAALARTQAAVRQRLGEDAPLDAVDVQLKGEHLSLVLHTAGRDRCNFTVNAATGQIEAQSKDEGESFIRRLHSGEVFGDAGVVLGILWGLALIALTITGVLLYGQMWRTRRRAHAAVVAKAASVLVMLLPCWAGR